MTAAASDTPEHLCANCGTSAPDRYCPACGQDTRDRLPTFAQFMREATGRYLSFDGKLWKTLVPLMFRPGFLTRAYLAGRRKRYIGPARLFLVSSLMLFAVLRFATESIDIDTVDGGGVVRIGCRHEGRCEGRAEGRRQGGSRQPGRARRRPQLQPWRPAGDGRAP